MATLYLALIILPFVVSLPVGTPGLLGLTEEPSSSLAASPADVFSSAATSQTNQLFPESQSPSQDVSSTHVTGLSTAMIALIVTLAVIVPALCLSTFLWIRKRRRQRQSAQETHIIEGGGGGDVSMQQVSRPGLVSSGIMALSPSPSGPSREEQESVERGSSEGTTTPRLGTPLGRSLVCQNSQPDGREVGSVAPPAVPIRISRMETHRPTPLNPPAAAHLANILRLPSFEQAQSPPPTTLDDPFADPLDHSSPRSPPPSVYNPFADEEESMASPEGPVIRVYPPSSASSFPSSGSIYSEFDDEVLH